MIRSGIVKYRRRLIQVLTAILYNCNFIGFAQGSLYKGATKGICVPGLNCYSCPGAIGTCPIGSLQSALQSYKFRFPYYILGMMILMGVVLGRTICGFLCPFGLIQELLYKIPTPKLPKNRVTRVLSLFKYLVLAVLVIIVPLAAGYPGFCKYICPAGTLQAGIPLGLADPQIRGMLGALFTWKMIVLVLIIAASIFAFRSFCRFLCPLGAFYSLFHKVAVAGLRVDESRCSHCGACTKFCRMDIKVPGDRECIQCGACKEICGCDAIRYSLPGRERIR